MISKIKNMEPFGTKISERNIAEKHYAKQGNLQFYNSL